MKETIKQCPKVFETFKKDRINFFKQSYGDNVPNISDDLWIKSMTESRCALFSFFDKFDLIGTLDYNDEDKEFECRCNNAPCDIHEDHRYHETREEAEKTLIKYLFFELEKTL